MAKRPPKQYEIDAADALKALDDDYLDCRDMRHPWQKMGYFRSNGYVGRRLQCVRCGMERTDRWYTTGQRDPSLYRAPEGYRLRGSHVTLQDVRLEVLRRAKGTIARSESALDREDES